MFKIAHLMAAAALVWPGIAASAVPPAATAQPAKKADSANERICENITLTGSRLGTKRFCGTRADWQERKMRDREEIDKAQRMPCVTNGTTCK
jgi:hypothetical protein